VLESKKLNNRVSVNFKLRVLWLENSLGLAIDQLNSNLPIQLTTFYFWPKTDAWEQLKVELQSKPWVDKKDVIKLLNDISEIMNHWQKNRKIQELENVKLQFKKIEFVGTL